MSRSFRAAAAIALALTLMPAAHAQTLRRLRGKVLTDAGAPLANATIRTEGLYGYAAGPFSGQRTFTTTSDAKGEWTIMGIKSGIWMFDVNAPGYLPESIALPIQVLTTETSGMSGVAYTWTLVLKAAPMPEQNAARLAEAAAAAFSGDKDKVQQAFAQTPSDADAAYFGGAGRIALVARDPSLARALFTQSLEKDTSSYRAALGIASTFVMLRDFDNASRALDAARSRTHDKDEQKFLTVAIGDLATIKVR